MKWIRIRGPVLIAIGVITPMGVLAVNGAAFVMRHLAEFRAIIAGAALLSSLLLNSLAAYSAIRFAQRNAPLLYAEYRRWALAGATVIVLGTSAAAAYLTYLGLSDPARLPDRTSILASVFALAVPFAITYLDRRYLRRRELGASGASPPTPARGQAATVPPAPSPPRRPRG
ncbi:MAG TPA: hypothetical protein VNI34_06320 [Candidatus Nitrosotalea sp.]|nr:hypothetical protein [Candidatus Nitrosotalea sp.]